LDAKHKREEADWIAEQEAQMKEQKNEAMRRMRDLEYEKKDMQAILDNPDSYEEDIEWATTRIYEIDDEISWYQQQEEDALREIEEQAAETERIAEERRIAEEEAFIAEMEEQNQRIEWAREEFEWAEKDFFDAVNELEVYKELLGELDPENEADQETYWEVEQEMLYIQMDIGYKETHYDEMRKEYDRLAREKERTDEFLAAFEAQQELREATEGAERFMKEAQENMDNLSYEISDLNDRLGKTQNPDTRDEIEIQLDELRGELTGLEEAFDVARTAFNDLAKQSMAVEA